ncbi:biopolymer transporter ExbD [Sulfitobacter geojensis]|uniref:Biopolymer transporter ExbD n=1 Tax=Sulfitobacter geojensis TaxID=1342299 RepID=A0AAE2W0Z9_9RHOB|nr:biopolymer transporter ExbD [Sulfitobacter geojensis]MBM1691258.1 biopolymer transporter ExbD [Sulfitobacter geojensis]MBM1695419.1 biopolymer transporter ExbD [Sulfitobacter geojensis]MBM1707519.1 biopolymer transporter ExbD [Sulfitobacter geojensis]MBM1711574.1 biopolymer transporter ExbD [Sulfitobacter geojensis]MBM1715549.1 biopolymer transporter ExbD [Sulfitobacter geojensis]
MAPRRRPLPRPSEPIRPDVSLFIVNIVLLLILFFLATGSLVSTPDEGVRISETRDLPIDQLPKPVLIVEEDGRLTLDGEELTADGLPQAMVGHSVLHVLIDRTAPALDLLKLVNRPGMENLDIRLVTIHRSKGT